jgi:hypothetical protein
MSYQRSWVTALFGSFVKLKARPITGQDKNGEIARFFFVCNSCCPTEFGHFGDRGAFFMSRGLQGFPR